MFGNARMVYIDWRVFRQRLIVQADVIVDTPMIPMRIALVRVVCSCVRVFELTKCLTYSKYLLQ